MQPIILLAFANDKQNTGAGYLRGLTQERNAIRDALMKAEENGLCQVLVEPDATVNRIFDIFQNTTYRDRIAMFHYGGHAESYSLLLESASGGTAAANSEGLVAFLAKQKSLKLVFLNGCSSQKQSEDLVAAGLPAVIGTSEKINDTIATGLATRFYKGLSAGVTIERAWTDAVDQIKTENKTSNTAGLYAGGLLGSPGEEKFPWKLYTGEGGALSKAWNLPEAANQPLFGLELPNAYYRKLPSTPYVGLRSFKQEEAAIFFGRGTDIRNLYTQLESKQPVILFSGTKGVGKSSLLAAGLAPRLEAAHVVSYYTIDGKCLADSLSDALDQVSEAHGLEKLAPKDKSDLEEKIKEIQKLISSISGFAKEILAKELERLIRISTMERLTYYEQWMFIEEKTGLPLVVMLDELPHDPDDWKIFLEIMVSIFEAKTPPKGKLVLSIDEESHDPFYKILQSASFPYADVFLQPLTMEGINEAIVGNTLSPITKDFYRLQIENTPSNNLPVTLSGDLSEGDPTLVAPYLQVILSDLWKSAVKENAQTPSFTLPAYHQRILSGEIMEKFLSQQLSTLKVWKEEPVQSGLILDLLYLHTSAHSKSAIVKVALRDHTYCDRQDLADELVRKCKDLSLLTSAHSGGTNLGHNLLAPVVIRHYSISLSPGQQAARILNAKMSETKEADKADWLNESDLDTLEKGMKGMRCLNNEEIALLELSRAKRIQSQKDRKRNKVIRVAVATVVVIFAALAAWQWRVADQRYLYSRAGELAFAANEVLHEDNTLAFDIAHQAYSTLGINSPPLVIQTLSNIFHAQEETPFYASNFQHTKTVNTAVFSPDGKFVLTASEDGFATLWDLKGEKIISFPHVIEVKKAAFSPNGQQILTLTLTHAYLWEKDGTITDTLSKPDIVTNLDLFSTDGVKIIASNMNENTSTYFSNVTNLGQKNKLVFSSPEGNRILSINDGICALFDKDGTLLKDSLTYSVKDSVIDASFSKDGTQFLTVSIDSDTCHVSVWNEAGDYIHRFRVKHKASQVKAVFSPDSKSILTASDDFTAKLWDFSDPFLHRFPLPSTEYGGMYTVDFSPEGYTYLTASNDSTARIWDSSGKLKNSLKHGDVVISAFFSPDGKRIVTASKDSTARIWNPKESKVIPLKHGKEVTSAVFSHNGLFVLTASKDRMVRLWNLDGTIKCSFPLNGDVTLASLSPDDKQMLSISSDSISTDKEVTLWDSKGDSLRVFRHPAKVYSAIFSPDGKSLLTNCEDSVVRQWSSIAPFKLLHSFPHFEKPYKAIFSADGKQIITGGKIIKIWSKDGILKDSLSHDKNVSKITISPDGSQILTTCNDFNAYLWDFKGELLAEYKGHKKKLTYGCFTPDGNHVLTAADDGFIIRWKTPQAIFKDVKTMFIYQLSQKEQELYGIKRWNVPKEILSKLKNTSTKELPKK